MEKKILFHVMYSAFVQLRAEAYERNDKFAFRVCDLLHNVPLKLLAAENEEDYKIIYSELLHYINHNGMKPWLDQELQFIDYKGEN